MTTPRVPCVAIEVHPHVAGGTEHFLARLLRHLDRERFTPLAVVAEPGPTLALFEAAGVRTAVIETPEVFLRRSGVGLVQSSYYSPALALAAAQAGVPHVWRVGGRVEVVQHDRSPRERSVFLGVMACLSRALICGSRFLGAQFEGVGATNLRVVPNGVDLEEFSPAPERADHRPPTVGMVGHLLPQKRHEDFLHAAALVHRVLPDVRFRVFGAPDRTTASHVYAERMRGLAVELGVDGRLAFEHLQENRPGVLGAVDVFAMPSLDEGASNAVLEAMALGRPVVAARSGSHPELVEDGVTGLLVPPESPRDLADALLGLLRSSAIARGLGAAGRRRAEERFDVRRSARDYAHVYAEAIGPGP